MLEISGEDISLLSDGQLRELIGLLCEAECKCNRISPSGVIWSGHQDAKDGGLDVIVDIPNPLPGGFIPRAKTGFQVKKPAMRSKEILSEIKPKGIVRDSIKSLIGSRGSYIIVSSAASVTGSALETRLQTMRDAIANELDCDHIALDFYDRGRVATWVRTHPSLILWVRNKIGRALKGWQPYENWAWPGQEQEPYLIDEKVRLYNGTEEAKESEIDIINGINKIRSILSASGTCIRLAGLSGVGKTRFVQAVFDESIGEGALNSSQVLYTDISNGPEPDPRTLAQQLITQEATVTLVVDNCPPDLHRKLAEVCSGPKSTISLLTVEYDVRDDLPEETQVFRLEPASDDLIQKLIQKRFDYLSEVDRRTIANFAGGNARIALALAGTVRRGETVSGFHNEELFERLFQQRNSFNADLIKSAQVLSLVYSFEGTNTEAESELSVLASLISKTSNDLYNDAAELKRRDLVQSRSIWRAVLPHAIANRLAKKALESIPVAHIQSTFLCSASERLLKSFTRRLSFLHDCDAAVQLVTGWLKEDGWLGKLDNLNQLGISALENIAPVAPDKVLEAIERSATNERFTSRSNSHYYQFVSLLRSLAFDENLFIQSTRIIVRFALSERVDENTNSTRKVLKSLFPLFLSGTHASAEVRYSIIHELVSSTNTNRQDLGFLLLDSALEACHFQSMHNFDFGARPRDYGYLPKTREKIVEWYKFFIEKSVDLALLKGVVALKAKKVLADNFRCLWTKACMYDELEMAVKKITGNGNWQDGWVEARSIIYYDKDDLENDILERIKNVVADLMPLSLVEKIRIYALSERSRIFEIIESDDGNKTTASLSWARAEEITVNLGVQLAQSEIDLMKLLPDLVAVEGVRLWSLGKGLAKGCDNSMSMWDTLKKQIEQTPKDKANVKLLLGFFCQLSIDEPETANIILDDVLTHSLLKTWFPDFQTSIVIDDLGVKRIHKALDDLTISITRFVLLGNGRNHQTIPDDCLAELLLKINFREQGNSVASDILKMRFFQEEPQKYSEALISAGRIVLENVDYTLSAVNIHTLDHELSAIAEVCLVGEEAVQSAIAICKNFVDSMAPYQFNHSNFSMFLNSIAAHQPLAFLDNIVDAEKLKEYESYRLLRNDFERNQSPFYKIPEEILIRWCDIRPYTRYKLLLSVIPSLIQEEQNGQMSWISIVWTILDKAPNLKDILPELEDGIRSGYGRSNWSLMMQTRLVLFENFFNHENAEIAAWARKAHLNLQKAIASWKQQEESWNRKVDESFE